AAGVRRRALPSPARGRRWPREAGSDEGSRDVPTLLRGTPPRAGRDANIVDVADGPPLSSQDISILRLARLPELYRQRSCRRHEALRDNPRRRQLESRFQSILPQSSRWLFDYPCRMDRPPAVGHPNTGFAKRTD